MEKIRGQICRACIAKYGRCVLPSMEGVLEMGEQFQVKLTDIDKQGRVKLSRKVLLPKPERSEK